MININYTKTLDLYMRSSLDIDCFYHFCGKRYAYYWLSEFITGCCIECSMNKDMQDYIFKLKNQTTLYKAKLYDIMI